jgi:hypothetical protein
MVKGIRSPSSLIRNTTNCPGLLFRAISGAATLNCFTEAARSLASTIGNTVFLLFQIIRHFDFSNNDGKHHQVKTPQQPGRNFHGKRLFLPKMGNIAAQKDQGNLPA